LRSPEPKECTRRSALRCSAISGARLRPVSRSACARVCVCAGRRAPSAARRCRAAGGA
jgi:hypothetical protein